MTQKEINEMIKKSIEMRKKYERFVEENGYNDENYTLMHYYFATDGSSSDRDIDLRVYLYETIETMLEEKGINIDNDCDYATEIGDKFLNLDFDEPTDLTLENLKKYVNAELEKSNK